MGVNVVKTEIGLWPGNGRGPDKLLVTQWVGLPAARSAGYFRQLGERFARQITALPHGQVEEICRLVMLEVGTLEYGHREWPAGFDMD